MGPGEDTLAQQQDHVQDIARSAGSVETRERDFLLLNNAGAAPLPPEAREDPDTDGSEDADDNVDGSLDVGKFPSRRQHNPPSTHGCCSNEMRFLVDAGYDRKQR